MHVCVCTFMWYVCVRACNNVVVVVHVCVCVCLSLTTLCIIFCCVALQVVRLIFDSVAGGVLPGHASHVRGVVLLLLCGVCV